MLAKKKSGHIFLLFIDGVSVLSHARVNGNFFSLKYATHTFHSNLCKIPWTLSSLLNLMWRKKDRVLYFWEKNLPGGYFSITPTFSFSFSIHLLSLIVSFSSKGQSIFVQSKQQSSKNDTVPVIYPLSTLCPQCEDSTHKRQTELFNLNEQHICTGGECMKWIGKVMEQIVWMVL